MVGDGDRALLSGAELDRMERLRHPASQDRFAAGWALVRRTLAELTGVPARDLEFDRSCEHCDHPAHGRPRLAWAGPHFSLSHSGDRVLLATCADRPVGADVEAVGRDVDRIRRLILHPAEPQVEGLDLLRVWVRKEAALKAIGLGLKRPMTTLDVSATDSGMRVRDIDADHGYVAAVCTVD